MERQNSFGSAQNNNKKREIDSANLGRQENDSGPSHKKINKKNTINHR